MPLQTNDTEAAIPQKFEMTASVTCIIPFHNEAGRIAKITKTVVSSALIDEVIMVDDGSTDGGCRFNHHKCSLIALENNKGKSAAIRIGLEQAKGDIIMLIDADLIGLKVEHIEQLLYPILNRDCEITISRREIFSFFDVVSGERAFYKTDFLDFFLNTHPRRNANEIVMNQYVICNSMRIKAIKWKGVSQEYKSFKIGFFTGIFQDVRHVLDWMHQMGRSNFCFVYLLFWLKLNGWLPSVQRWLTRSYLKIYSR